MRALALRSVFALALFGLAACQGPDVGGPCTFNLPGVDASAASADLLETGPLTDCDTLVCIASPATTRLKHNPYCSKACVSNADCSQGETGLVCRPVVLDPNFLNHLDPALRQQYLGDIAFSNYCAAPLQ